MSREKLGHRGAVLAGGDRFPSVVSTPSAGATLSPGTHLLTNGSGGAQQYALPTPKVGQEFQLIVSSFTTSTGTDKVVDSAPSGVSFGAAADQDNLVFDAADEAVTVRALSATRYGIISNVGGVTSSSST